MVLQYHHPNDPPPLKGCAVVLQHHCESTFNMLKLVFTTTPVLTHWIPNVPQIIETNASDYAIMVIHSIQTPNGELHPIAFHLQIPGPLARSYVYF